VPVLRDLVESLLSLQQRLLRGVSRAIGSQRRHLTALARALPRPDALFALPQQRFDSSAGRLRGALFQNLRRHGARLDRATALLRPRVIRSEIGRGREGVEDLDARLRRAYSHSIRRASGALEGCARVLETVSFRAVLERGFALVRGPDGELKRRAAAIRSGEHLTLTFSDGEAKATGGRAGGTRTTTPGKGQGDLF